MYDAENRKAVVYAHVYVTTAGGEQDWELVQMLSFDESGEKVTRFEEFFDTKVFLDQMEAMNQARAAGA